LELMADISTDTEGQFATVGPLPVTDGFITEDVNITVMSFECEMETSIVFGIEIQDEDGLFGFVGNNDIGFLIKVGC
jgi:hypothetical protein